jgi:hypothetical protein
MLRVRVVVAVCAGLFALALPGQAAAPAKPKANANGHAHHLLKAEEDLVEAEASIAQGNLAKAQKHVAAAIKQVEEAIAHHHKHHIAPQGQSNGLSTAMHNGKHHKHHSLLKQALAELVVAEKELKDGAGAQASKEIDKAAKTIKNAVASHHHLFGKQ